MKEKIVVKIDGRCRQNPHGEMSIAYIIEFQNGETEEHFEIIESKYGNTMISAEYLSLNKALERLIALNLTSSCIEVCTTSSQILMHFLGHIRPNKGFYVGEALRATKSLKRFNNFQVIKVERKDNIEAASLSNKSNKNYYKP